MSSIVAMTREMGSLGKDVGAALADRLGGRLVHHEIIDLLANRRRVRNSHVIRYLERDGGIDQPLTAERTLPAIYSADEMFRLAERGDAAVIRGWGATHLFRPVRHVLCVRVCAPFALRVQRIMERLQTDDRERVESEIRMNDEAHGAIMRRHFGIDWQDPEHYDLVLDTERVSVGECVDKIMALVDDPEFAETEWSNEVFRALALESYVRAALRLDPRTRELRVGVRAEADTVFLSGVVFDSGDARLACDLAAGIAGVREVRSTLLLAHPPSRLDS
jgi:cytidylate kinase